jgi:hypothetical protein
VREFIRRLEAVGLTVESTPGHYRVLREGKPLRKQNGMPFTLPFSPDTTAGAERRSSSSASSASSYSVSGEKCGSHLVTLLVQSHGPNSSRLPMRRMSADR